MNNKFPILKIINIKWDPTSKNKDNLPKEIELQWNSKKWGHEQVSNWLSNHFNATLNNFNIELLENNESGG